MLDSKAIELVVLSIKNKALEITILLGKQNEILNKIVFCT